MRYFFCTLLVAAIGLSSSFVGATHLRCGDIQVTHLSGRTVSITVRVYTNTINTTVLFGGDQDVLDFGDGTSMLIPEQQGTTVDGFPPSIQYAFYTVQHTYANPGSYVVSYSEPNRNEGIINFDASVVTPFYLETSFTLDALIGAYSSPASYFHPIFNSSEKIPLSVSVAATDGNGSELLYSVVTPLSGRNRPVIHYKLAENFSVDPISGLVTWDNLLNGAFVAGEYLFAIRIDQYATVAGKRRRVGYVYRDFQIIVEDAIDEGGRMPSHGLDDINLHVPDGESRSFKVTFPHEDDETVDVLFATEFPDTHSELSSYDSVSGVSKFSVARIEFHTDATVLRDHPYVISLRFTVRKTNPLYSTDVNFVIFTKDYDPIMGTEHGKFAVTLFPNPSNDFVWVRTDVDSRIFLELMSMEGRVIRLNSLKEPHQFDLRPLAKGIYFARVKDDQGRVLGSERLVKRD